MGSPGSIEDSSVIILFDGVCNLCNGLVQFIIRRDPEARFRFASLQSEFGQSQLVRFKLDTQSLHSIVVVDQGHAFEKSDAVFRITKHLGGPWKMLAAFNILPTFILDSLYNLIAANRYRIFGKRDSCMIPTPELSSRFLDGYVSS